jgi:hypothetical protein
MGIMDWFSRKSGKDSSALAQQKPVFDKRATMIIDTNDKIIHASTNEYIRYIEIINEIVNKHLEKLYKKCINSNSVFANYLDRMRGVICPEFGQKIVEKLILTMSDNKRHNFSQTQINGIESVTFLFVTYPLSKMEIKESDFKNSYIDKFHLYMNNIYEDQKLSQEVIQNSTFFHIMFFVSNPQTIEVDMGIKSTTGHCSIWPIDILSYQDKLITGLLT